MHHAAERVTGQVGDVPWGEAVDGEILTPSAGHVGHQRARATAETRAVLKRAAASVKTISTVKAAQAMAGMSTAVQVVQAMGGVSTGLARAVGRMCGGVHADDYAEEGCQPRHRRWTGPPQTPMPSYSYMFECNIMYTTTTTTQPHHSNDGHTTTHSNIAPKSLNVALSTRCKNAKSRVACLRFTDYLPRAPLANNQDHTAPREL